MIAIGCDEHLGLVPQTAEGDRVDDAVAVALEDVARTARAAIGFGVQAAARSRRDAQPAPREASFRAEWHNLVSWGIAPFERVDADHLQILGEVLGIGMAAERTDDQPHAVRALGYIAGDSIKQLAVLGPDPLKLGRKRVCVRIRSPAAARSSAARIAARLRRQLLARHWRRISNLRRPRCANSAEPLPARVANSAAPPGRPEQFVDPGKTIGALA